MASSSHSPTLTGLDLRIIAELQVQGRRPYSRIAKDLDVSESVVRYRVQRLEDAGILQIVGIADPLAIGFDRMAVLGLRVRPGTLNAVAAAAAALPESSYVVRTAGSFDVFVEVVCRDRPHFAELLTSRIHGIDGVVSADTFFVLGIDKLAYGWGVGEVDTMAAEEPAG